MVVAVPGLDCTSETDNGMPPARMARRSMRELGVGVGEVGDHLHDAAPVWPTAGAIADQLVLAGAVGRRQLAVDAPVVQRPRGREPERARRHRLPGEAAISAASSGVACTWAAALVPMTSTRSAACGTWAATSTSYRRPASTPR